jgi:hypothetical protein
MHPNVIMQEALASKPVEERFEVELSTLYDRWRGNCRAAPLMTDRTSLTIRLPYFSAELYCFVHERSWFNHQLRRYSARRKKVVKWHFRHGRDETVDDVGSGSEVRPTAD